MNAPVIVTTEVPLPQDRRSSGVGRDLLRLALAQGLGVGEPQADVLVTLLEHQGERLTSAQLCRLLNKHRPLRLNVFQERIRLLREVMGRDAIAGFATAKERQFQVAPGKFRYGFTTYGISAEGVAKCGEALRAVADLLPLRPVAEKPTIEAN